MSEFTGTVEALLAGRTVRAALLMVITWADSSITRLWTGMGPITIGGQEYKGSGQLISVDGIGGGLGTQASNATFRMSGVDATIAAKAAEERDQAADCQIECFIQVFGDGALAGEWQPVDSPIGLGLWQGDQLTFERSDAMTRNVVLTAVNFFATRSLPLSSYYSDRDQQQRYPGDRGGEFMSSLINASVHFPFAALGE